MRKSLLASVLLLSCASQIVGQSSTGSIVGTVVDAQGLPIKDATVTLTNLGTNSSYGSSTGRTAATNLRVLITDITEFP